MAILVLVILSLAEKRAPFDDVEFIEEHPGAGDRFVLFTPVLRSNQNVIVGEPVGADCGVIHFRDCDQDGLTKLLLKQKETISVNIAHPLGMYISI